MLPVAEAFSNHPSPGNNIFTITSPLFSFSAQHLPPSDILLIYVTGLMKDSYMESSNNILVVFQKLLPLFSVKPLFFSLYLESFLNDILFP